MPHDDDLAAGLLQAHPGSYCVATARGFLCTDRDGGLTTTGNVRWASVFPTWRAADAVALAAIDELVARGWLRPGQQYFAILLAART